MNSPLLAAGALLFKTFLKYAENDEQVLSRKAVKDLVEKELSFLQGDEKELQQEELDDIMKSWDEDGDDTVNFEEFTKMVADIAFLSKEKILPLSSKVGLKKC